MGNDTYILKIGSSKHCGEMKFHYVFVALLAAVLISGCTQTVQQVEQENGPTDSSLLDIKESGKIVIGTYAKLDPMTYLDDSGEFVGHDIEIAKEIASKLGVSVEFQDIFFPDMLEAAKSGEIDIALSAITITTERSEEMLFSIPYFDAGQTMVVMGDNDNITTPGDMEGKMIGVMSGTTGEKAVLALDYIDPSMVKVAEEKEDRVNSLLDGEVDVIVEDLVGASGVVKNNPSLKIVGDPFTQEYYGIATQLGNDALMKEINSILREMKTSGKLKEIKDKWLG